MANTDFHSFSFSYLSFSLKEPRFGLVNQSGVLSFFTEKLVIIHYIRMIYICPYTKTTKQLLRN